MLLNLHKRPWDFGLTLEDYDKHSKDNKQAVADMLKLAKLYNKVWDGMGCNNGCCEQTDSLHSRWRKKCP
jgi:hypothetical protein